MRLSKIQFRYLKLQITIPELHITNPNCKFYFLSQNYKFKLQFMFYEFGTSGKGVI